MTTKKNYYVCLRFKSRPKIHMTLRYFKGLAPDELASLVAMLSKFMAPPVLYSTHSSIQH